MMRRLVLWALPGMLWGMTPSASLYLLHEAGTSDSAAAAKRSASAIGARLGGVIERPGMRINLQVESTSLLDRGDTPSATSLADETGRGVTAMTRGNLRLIDGYHTLTIGRQTLDTMLLNTDASHYLQNAYGGAVYAWESGGLRAFFGHVIESRSPDASYFDRDTPVGEAAEGLSFAGWQKEARGIPRLSHALTLYRAPGLFDALALQADGWWGTDTMEWLLGVQSIHTAGHGGESLESAGREGGADVAVTELRTGFWYRDRAGAILAYHRNTGSDGLGRMYGGRVESFVRGMIHDPTLLRGEPETLSLRLRAALSPDMELRLYHNRTTYGATPEHDDYTGTYARFAWKDGTATLALEGEQLRCDDGSCDQELFRVRVNKDF